MFTWCRGSRGDGTADFSLLVPFRLTEGRTLKDQPPSISLHDSSLAASIEAGAYNHYVMRVAGFSSHERAEQFIASARLWLQLAFLRLRTGIYVHTQHDEITWADEPSTGDTITQHVMRGAGWDTYEGMYTMPNIVIVPEGRRLVQWWAGNISVHIGMSGDTVANAFSASASLGRGATGDATWLALDAAVRLFSLSYFENSPQARLVLRVSALEPLTVPSPPPAPVLQAIADFIAIANERRVSAPDSQHSSFDALSKELEKIRDGGHARRFRNTFSDLLSLTGRSKTSTRERLDLAYDLRSRIAHGEVVHEEPVTQINAFLEETFPEIVQQMLLADE